MKDKKIKYTDMCIYIDNNINKPDADVEKIYDYLVKISYMLASKKWFFKHKSEYGDFANYFASVVYMRMTDKRQFLPETDKNWLRPIKSCLNYMKKILYPRLCSFCAREMPKEDDNDDTHVSDIKMDMYRRYTSMEEGLRDVELSVYFQHIDREIFEIIENGFYGKNKVLCWKLYISVLLSLLNSFTLTNDNLKKLNNYKNLSYYKNTSGEMQPIARYDYENFIFSLMKDSSTITPLLLGLDKRYEEYVIFITQKVRVNIYNAIKEMDKTENYAEDILEDVLFNTIVEEIEE